MKFIRLLNSKFEVKSYFNLGNIFFLTGVFFLPSALPLGAFFLLTSIIFAFFTNKISFLQNKWNLIFLICLILIILSTIFNSTINPRFNSLEFDKSIVWINLFNWIPIYFAFVGFLIYLKSVEQRLLFQKVLIAGTVPVIISCIMQKFLNIYGPFETLFGTIVWFNYKHSLEEASGLFNNPNYLGMWLTLCLPFALSAIKLEKNRFINLIIIYLINILIIYFAFATFSRNAILGIILSLVFLFERKKLIFFYMFFFLSLIVFIYVLPNIFNIHQINFSALSDSRIFYKLSSLQFSIDNPRILIWSNALNFISMRPILGWGGGSFPYVFSANSYLEIPFSPETIIKYQHTHNLLVELAYNFGLPTASLIIVTVFSLFIKAFKKIQGFSKSLSSSLVYKPFLVSFSIFLVAHFSDVTYYDGKISIMFALLLAGIKNITDDIDLKENI